jgi:2,4-dienoyl-CoA reductase-like NADH-dependent reductase (Old Yellow Enzyme family)
MSAEGSNPHYPHVAAPIQIAGCVVPNRIARAAHGSNLPSTDGLPTEEWIAYHEARAAGGVGLTIVELGPVHPSSAGTIPGWLRLHDDAIVPHLERFTSRLHKHGQKAFQQIWHGGVNAPSQDGTPSWSASPITDPLSGRVPIEMTKAMIDEVVDSFAATARRCEDAGYDGVEVHAAHSYLIHQFLTPVYNRRTDDYGGSLENRMRFLEEVLVACRDRVQTDFAVGVRLSAIDLAPGGMEPDEVAVVAERLEAKGLIDFADVSISTYHAQHKFLSAMHDPHGYELPTSRPVTAAVTVPTIVTGRIATIAEAEAIIADGTADMVSMVRATIADPAIVAKSLAGEAERVRPCIGCNQGCIGKLFAGEAVGCTVNPDAGRETLVPELEKSGRRKVLVIGGGPAGMEAAHAAAQEGHDVVLQEAGDALGGQVRTARTAVHRDDLGTLTDWQAAELERLGVEVMLNTEATVDSVREEGADVVMVATGSARVADGYQRHRPFAEVEGLDRPTVMTSAEVLAERPSGVRRALVFDDLGDTEAPSVAETLMQAGAAITFATSHPTLAPLADVSLQREPYLLRLHGDERFELLIRQSITKVTESGAELEGLDGGLTREVPADLVVLVGRPLARRELHGELVAAGIEARVIGDAMEATDLVHAVHSGRAAARALGAA